MEVSGLSKNQRIEIIGTYLKHKYGKTLSPHLTDRGLSEKQIKKLQEKFSRVQADYHSICGLSISRVERFDFPNYEFYLSAFHIFDEHGTLPDKGPYYDQPAQTLEIFDIFKAIQSEEIQKQQKEMNKKQQSQTRKRR